MRVAGFLPYAALLPRVDLMVTNGGWGGTLAALSHGIPLVIAGGDLDKPEIAARVAWTGAGVNLTHRHAVDGEGRRGASTAFWAMSRSGMPRPASASSSARWVERKRAAELLEAFV